MVRPGEVTPEGVKAVRVKLCPDKNRSNKNINNGGKTKAFAVCALIDAERLGNCQAQAAERSVTGSDRENDDADDGNDSVFLKNLVE